ncbi:MAG: hypothetical protein KF723_05385 [Rhizobiaceae bacterium]|nr:hypothetical protein [Rhizobiaceae bacterium]
MANKFRVVKGLTFDQIEKAPGWDWVVFYLDADNPEILSMSVFGQMTPEKAIEEARFSLEAGGGSSDYEILGLIRADKQIP